MYLVVKPRMSRIAVALALLCACLLFTHAQSTSAKSTAKPATSAKSKNSKPTTSKSPQKPQAKKSQNTKKSKSFPKLPAQSVLDSMAKKGDLIDFGEKNLSWLKLQVQGALQAESSRLDSSGVRMAVFGDSHIAGDFMPRVWRARFMEVDSVGFAYPIFPPFHQNLLIHYQHKGFEILNSRKDAYSDYPMGGIIARAKSEQAFVQLGLNFPKEQQDFLVRVVFRAPSTLGAFILRDSNGKEVRLGASEKDRWEISSPMALRFPVRINALLPNAMLGGYFIDTPALRKNPAPKPAHNQSYGVDTPESFVINLGINGARSDVWLKWNRALLERELELITQLDFIAISYGSNDAISASFNDKLYRENFSAFIALLRQYHPNATILLIGAPQVLIKRKDTGAYKPTTNYEAVRKATKQVARENHTLYFDMQDFIEESGGKQKWIAQALSKQDVHLSPYGYKLVAESIAYHLEALLAKQKLPKAAESTKALELDSASSHALSPPQDSIESAQDSYLGSKPETRQAPPESTQTKQNTQNSEPNLTPASTDEQNEQERDNQGTQRDDAAAKNSTQSKSAIPLPPDSSAAQEIWQELEMKEF